MLRNICKIHSYRQHILHRCYREDLDGIGQVHENPDSPEEAIEESPAAEACEKLDSSEDYCRILSKKEAGLFLIEIYKVPQSTLDSLIGDIFTRVESTVKYIAKMELEAGGIRMTKELEALFNSPYINQVFQGLHTEFLQKCFLRENFNFEVSL